MAEEKDNYYYNRIVREQGKDAADAIMRKIAPAGGKASKGGFAKMDKTKHRSASAKGGKVSRKKAGK